MIKITCSQIGGSAVHASMHEKKREARARWCGGAVAHRRV